MADIDTSKLKNLPPETRSRVEDALKKTLETELANVANVPSTEAMGHSRSRGAIFSRSRTADALRGQDKTIDSLVLKNMETMDDDAFNKFAERLGTLKNLKR